MLVTIKYSFILFVFVCSILNDGKNNFMGNLYIYIYIYICVCVCVCVIFGGWGKIK